MANWRWMDRHTLVDLEQVARVEILRSTEGDRIEMALISAAGARLWWKRVQRDDASGRPTMTDTQMNMQVAAWRQRITGLLGVVEQPPA
jgi:hypothetical protein